jgi:hypothetical protein
VVGPRLIQRPYRLYSRMLRPERGGIFFCFPKTWRETITYHLPEGWIPKMAGSFEMTGGPAEFRQSYTWEQVSWHVEGNVQVGSATFAPHREGLDYRLVLDSRFQLHPASSFCTADVAKQILPVMKAAERDAEERLTFIRAGKTSEK